MSTTLSALTKVWDAGSGPHAQAVKVRCTAGTGRFVSVPPLLKSDITGDSATVVEPLASPDPDQGWAYLTGRHSPGLGSIREVWAQPDGASTITVEIGGAEF